MKVVTDNYKEEITKLGKQIDAIIRVFDNDKLATENNNLLLTEDNMNLVVEQINNNVIRETITSADIYNLSIVNKGNLLSTLMKEVDFEVSQDLKIGDIIDCQFGLKVEDNYEYINYGKYIIYSKEKNEDTSTYSYVAFDSMLLSMIEVNDTSIVQGITVKQAIENICDKVGLNVNITSEDIENLPNLENVINEKAFTDVQMTYRDILDMICQCLGVSMVSENKNLYLKTPNASETVITTNGKEGTSIEIIDGKDYEIVDYKLKGNTYQQNYTGKNLVDLSPLTQDKLIIATSGQCMYEWVYDNEIGREVFHFKRTSATTNYPQSTFQIPVERFNPTGKNYAVIYKYKTEGNVSNGTDSGIWIGFSGRNTWETVGINSTSQVKNLFSPKSENWNIGVFRVSKENVEYERYNNSYTKMCICLGTSTDGIGIYVSDIMVVEITDEQYNDTNYYPTGLSLEFEPYTGSTIGNITPSPNPSYPQEIQSVEGIQTITIGDGTDSDTYEVNLEGKNLFDKNTAEQGKEISGGSIFNNSNWFVSDYIPIKYGETYVKNISSGNSCIIYDKDKQKISDNSTQFSQNKITITYENAKYIRINQYISNINDFQLEIGDTATTYVPYRSPIKLYDGDYITGTPYNWSIVRNNGVIDSYNGETITTEYISTTGGLDTGATIVYKLDTPTTTSITDTYLISQLNALKETHLFEGINNIEVSGNLPATLYIKYANNVGLEQIDEQNLKDTNVKFSDKYMINSVVLSRSEDTDTIYRRDEDSVAENGIHEFKIKDNLILQYDDRKDYIDEIFDQLNGLEFYVNDFESPGITYIDWLDFYNVKIGENTYKCLMLNDEIKIQQGLEETVYTDEPEETVTDYKTSAKTDKEVSFIVDKQNSRINGTVKKDDIIASLNIAIEDGQGIVNLKGNTVTIDSDKFKLNEEGYITATGGTLGAWTINNDGLVNNTGQFIKNVDVTVRGTTSKYGITNIYTLSDILIFRAILQGDMPSPNPGTAEFQHFDINNDGALDTIDLYLLKKIILGIEEESDN